MRHNDVDNDDDIFIAFRQLIPAGHSNFTVKVPSRHMGRKFHLSNCFLIPGLYSMESAAHNLDPDEELDATVNYPIYFSAKIQNDFWPGEFIVPVSETSPVAMATNLNNYFQTQMPAIVSHIGVFIDWVDLRYDESDGTWDNFVRNIMAQTYYLEPFNEAKHWDKLPPGAKNVHGSNNYLFPTSLTETNVQNLRFRICIAPNVGVVLSTNGQFLRMGFSDEQMGSRVGRGRGRYFFTNAYPEYFDFTIAQNRASYEMAVLRPLSVTLQPVDDELVTSYFNVVVSRRQELTNLSLSVVVAKSVVELSDISNINVVFTYNSGTQIFNFSLPPGIEIRVGLDTALAWRLGYGLVSSINESTSASDKVDDEINVKYALMKSRALCYDTGLVVISDNYMSANTTFGLSNQLVGTLAPSTAGTLELVPILNPPKISLPRTVSIGETGVIPLTFKISRFLDSGELVDLRWLVSSYVNGLLRSEKPRHSG